MFRISDFKFTEANAKPYIQRNEQVLKDLNVDWIWKETKGKGIKVAVIDTGIDLDHPDLAMNIKGFYNSYNSSSDVNDSNGHGTHCAGVIGANGFVKGIAPECDLYIIKAFEGENTTLAAIIRGIDWAINQGVDVISMSLGAQSDTPALQESIKRAYDAGIICVCAAGNDNVGSYSDTIDYPACYENTIAVGAVNSAFNVADFSSTGNVDVVATGVDVSSTYLNGSYAIMSGTSMAAPAISGAVALYQANAKSKLGRKLSFSEIKLVLAMNSLDLGQDGRDKQYGYGLFTF